jgi:hypothetical protein
VLANTALFWKHDNGNNSTTTNRIQVQEIQLAMVLRTEIPMVMVTQTIMGTVTTAGRHLGTSNLNNIQSTWLLRMTVSNFEEPEKGRSQLSSFANAVSNDLCQSWNRPSRPTRRTTSARRPRQLGLSSSASVPTKYGIDILFGSRQQEEETNDTATTRGRQEEKEDKQHTTKQQQPQQQD